MDGLALEVFDNRLEALTIRLAFDPGGLLDFRPATDERGVVWFSLARWFVPHGVDRT